LCCDNDNKCPNHDKMQKSDKKSKKNLDDEIGHDRPNHGDTYNYIYGRFSVLKH